MYNQTILLGVIISMIFTELTGLSAGLIVPGYLALSLHSPLRILCTLAVAAVSVLLCRLLARYVILYGRRRFALLLVLAYLVSMILDVLGLLPASVIGTILPGLIAREFDRQGFRDTILSLAVTTGLTALALLALGQGLSGF
jgi:poly-gamma-glutamate biosynthesis protein PgsC/CapC